MRLTQVAAAFALATLVLEPRTGGASGFAVSEEGVRAMGFAGAFTAQASDPSAIAYNAAAIAFLKGRQASIGGAWIRPRTTFTGSDPLPGGGVTERTQDLALLPPALFYAHQFSERLVLGTGFTRPFQVRTRWADPDTFTGRFLAQRTEIDAYSINPTAGYRVADRLSIGGGLDIRRSSMSFRRRFPGLHPETDVIVDAASVRVDSRRDTAIGWNVGVLARPLEILSLGAQYRHGITHEYQGDAEFSLLPTGSAALDAAVAELIPAGTLPFRSSIRFPASVTAGAAYQWGEWTFAGDARLWLWSRLDQIATDFEGRDDLREVVVQHYADSITIRVGAERRLGSAWAVRGGYAFDDSPAPASSMSPLLFDADRHRVGVGGSWQQGSLRVDAAAGFVSSRPRATGGTGRDAYEGAYETRALTAGVSLGYTF